MRTYNIELTEDELFTLEDAVIEARRQARKAVYTDNETWRTALEENIEKLSNLRKKLMEIS